MHFQKHKLQKTVTSILTGSISRKLGTGAKIEITDKENAFFKELVKQTEEAKLNPYSFYFEPMSDKSFSVRYGSYPIGKIKLNEKGSYIQVLKGLNGVKSFENLSLEEYLSYIPDWIRYIKFCLKD